MAILNFQKPDKVIMIDSTDYDGKFEFRPLEPGYGLTVGNALRRVLLSSLQGAAVTGIQVQGVLHEFSTIPGVIEDVTDIVLNVKGISLKMEVDGPKRLRLNAKGPLSVTADMIELTSDIEIMNPEHHICTLDKGSSLNVELKTVFVSVVAIFYFLKVLSQLLYLLSD